MPPRPESSFSDESNKESKVDRKRKIAIFVFAVVVIVCLVLLLVLVVTYALRLHCPSCSSQHRGETEQPVTEALRAGGGIIRFIHVSDIHGDVEYQKSMASEQRCRGLNGRNITAEYNAPYGRINCDSPRVLLDSTLNAMKSEREKAPIQFIMITGDSSPHNVEFDRERLFEGIALISSTFHEAFQDIPVFPVLGLNDLPGHFVLPNSSDWYERALSHWLPLIVCSKCPDEISRPTTVAALKGTFLDGGYYNASIADGKMVLLVLNTIYWHYRSDHGNPLVQNTAVRQFRWLESQLQLAKDLGKKVFIMSHAPPGIDSSTFDPIWWPEYTAMFLDLVIKKYHEVVAGQFYGYTHKDDFRVQLRGTGLPKDSASSEQAKSFALLAPSVSPMYQNHPAFRVMSLDAEEQSLVDYSQFYMDLVMANEFSDPVWQLDYTFSQKYQSPNKLLNANRIYELAEKLITKHNDTFWKAYVFSRHVNYSPGYYSRFALYCSVRHVLEEDYKKCIENYKVPGG